MNTWHEHSLVKQSLQMSVKWQGRVRMKGKEKRPHDTLDPYFVYFNKLTDWDKWTKNSYWWDKQKKNSYWCRHHKVVKASHIKAPGTTEWTDGIVTEHFEHDVQHAALFPCVNKCKSSKVCMFLCRCVCIRSVYDGHLYQRWSAYHRRSGSSLPVCVPAQLHRPWLPRHRQFCQPIRCLYWGPWWHPESQEDFPLQRGSTESVHSCLPGSECLQRPSVITRVWNSVTHTQILFLFRCTSCAVSVQLEVIWLAPSSVSHWSVWLC